MCSSDLEVIVERITVHASLTHHVGNGDLAIVAVGEQFPESVLEAFFGGQHLGIMAWTWHLFLLMHQRDMVTLSNNLLGSITIICGHVYELIGDFSCVLR